MSGTPAFLKENISLCKQITDEKLLFRLESGNDESENMGIPLRSRMLFQYQSINPPPRRKKSGGFHGKKEHCENVTTPKRPKDGLYRWKGDCMVSYRFEGMVPRKKSPIRIVYEIIERITNKYGQFPHGTLISGGQYHLWTNLDWNDQDIINNYHAHGEIRAVPQWELRRLTNLERLPSGKFDK